MFGAKGGAGVMQHCPDAARRDLRAFLAGDVDWAKAAQERLSPVRLALMMGTAPGVVKQAMGLIGWDVGPSRSPIAPLSAEKRQKLKEILTAAGLG